MQIATSKYKLMKILEMAVQKECDDLEILSGAEFSKVDMPKLWTIRLGDADRAYRPHRLPTEIFEIRSLRKLRISVGSLTELPTGINKLINLESLNLSGNSLTNLSLEIFQLPNLALLDLSENRLTFLPPEINRLAKLRSINLSGNKLTALSSEIGKLINLESLTLDHNALVSLPSEVASLTSLKLINLSNNLLKEIPHEVGTMISLENFDVGFNDLTELPSSMVNLSNLRELNLQDNKLTSLPADTKQLKKLQHLYLRGNKLPIPPEILQRVDEPQAIISYYWTLKFLGVEKKPLLESKVILVGQGSVGKTSLAQQILNGIFDPNQTKTEGISIKQWTMDDRRQTTSSMVNGPSSIKLNIWDFGGQEIMHATHQFFLTKRSLYLLVLDARLTQEENRVEYWLKIIQSFGGESPVLIIGNKIDQHPLDIDRTGLQKKYPNIVGILETSAATGAGIEALKTAITEQVNNLPHVRDLLPETWFTVKTKLEELGRQSNFITQEKYLDLCAENEVSDETSQRTLIGFLHDLGVVLHFQDDPRLEALGILNPQWVTNGVYKILNSHELFQNQGKLTLPMLNKILDLSEYPRDKRLFIVDMMKKFELCYDIEPDKTFLVPDLLPKDEPYTGEWDGALAFQYHYNVLPTSIITRFIVRMNAFIHKTVWRSGVVLKSGGNTALVKADTEDRKIYIWVSGEVATHKEFLAVIRAEFVAIHKTIAKIEAVEKVPLPDAPEATPIDLAFLQKLASEGRESLPVQVGNQIIDLIVEEVLSRIEAERKGGIEVGGSINEGTIISGNNNVITINRKSTRKRKS